MGTMAGNIIGVLLIAVAALAGLISLQVSAIIFATICYVLWAFFYASNFMWGGAAGSDFLDRLDQAERKAFKAYNIHIHFSGAGELISALLNILRLAGIVWAGVCAWQEQYIIAGFPIVFFFVSGGLILKTNPILYMGRQAANGNNVAVTQLALIDRVASLHSEYLDEKDKEETSESILEVSDGTTDLGSITSEEGNEAELERLYDNYHEALDVVVGRIREPMSVICADEENASMEIKCELLGYAAAYKAKLLTGDEMHPSSWNSFKRSMENRIFSLLDEKPQLSGSKILPDGGFALISNASVYTTYMSELEKIIDQNANLGMLDLPPLLRYFSIDEDSTESEILKLLRKQLSWSVGFCARVVVPEVQSVFS